VLIRVLVGKSLYTASSVDGGVGIETVPLIVEAGATVLIAGSSVYNSKGSVKDNVDALLKSAQ
jgi:pentose-5-phosphate-3-epimerase